MSAVVHEAAHQVDTLLAQLGAHRIRRASREAAPDIVPRPSPLHLMWPGLDTLLPDGGLPPGVVELASPHALGGATSLALAAVHAGQQRNDRMWCAWLDPDASLHAPGVVAAGVTLERLLVIRPPRALLGRFAIKVVTSGAFAVVVVDIDPVPLAQSASGQKSLPGPTRRAWAPEVLVRKLSLAAEPTGATVLLLTDATKPRSVPWPVALRLELHRPTRGELAIRVAKDRRGRVGLAKTVPFGPLISPVPVERFAIA